MTAAVKATGIEYIDNNTISGNNNSYNNNINNNNQQQQHRSTITEISPAPKKETPAKQNEHHTKPETRTNSII